MKCVEVKISGTVQGVGFRPFIYRTAKKFSLYGFIANISFGVLVEFEGMEQNIVDALEYIQNHMPRGASIDSIQVSEKDFSNYKEFKIVNSQANSNNKISVSPDLGICKGCLEEMDDPKSRFYKYPFISCASCGPRLTILEDIPYDRPYTSMIDFEMCEECKKDYSNPEDRRYHAQTISCNKCGPKLWMDESDNAIDTAIKMLQQGKIVGIKGVGGYHIACNAQDDNVVDLLRQRKKRLHKPFAVMMSFEKILEHCYVSKFEKELLMNTANPIVLLRQKEGSTISKHVNSNVNTLGVMLPYTGIHKLLTGQIDALVMTSGNISGEPIITSEQDAKTKLSNVADSFISHNRRITIGCDDSVIKCINNATIIIRRSRGFVPLGISLGKNVPDLLACGGDLKNTFCIFTSNNAYLSQHIGDLINKCTFDWYIKNINDFRRLLKANFKYVACDYHPEYQSTKYAYTLDLPIIKVQHHHAHIASVIGEHNIEGEVIGVAFDGTGYGDDNSIWGGEFFSATRGEYTREYHLDYVKMPGGEAAVKEPWRMAISYLYNTYGQLPDIEFVNTKEEYNIILSLIQNSYNSPQTSSMGRFFDAVSSLIGIRDTITYEGQAAVELEAIADKYTKEVYSFEIEDRIIYTKSIVGEVVNDIKKGITKQIISGKFHNTLSDIVLEACKRIYKKKGLRKVVLAGGVFQNTTLLERCINQLTKHGFTVYFNSIVPLNDAGLSFGQTVVASDYICTL